MRAWEESGAYRWDPNRPREETFVIDTPPPTVSGSLHLGHVFSYTQQDVLARYNRMRGKNISWPHCGERSRFNVSIVLADA